MCFCFYIHKGPVWISGVHTWNIQDQMDQKDYNTKEDT